MADDVAPREPERPLSNAYQNWYRFSRNPTAVIGAAIVILCILAAIFAPLRHALSRSMSAPSSISARAICRPRREYWFGTDNVGRDLFTRVVFGLRVSLLLALVVLGTAIPVGTVLGLLAGYFGGWIEIVIMRLDRHRARHPAAGDGARRRRGAVARASSTRCWRSRRCGGPGTRG